jgi:hypothetical protein
LLSRFTSPPISHDPSFTCSAGSHHFTTSVPHSTDTKGTRRREDALIRSSVREVRTRQGPRELLITLVTRHGTVPEGRDRAVNKVSGWGLPGLSILTPPRPHDIDRTPSYPRIRLPTARRATRPRGPKAPRRGPNPRGRTRKHRFARDRPDAAGGSSLIRTYAAALPADRLSSYHEPLDTGEKQTVARPGRGVDAFLLRRAG